MASSRPTRKSSRMSSPFTTSAKDLPATQMAIEPRLEKKTFMEKWVEPVVRPAVPSFEDHKGIERGGVLEFMQPLGTLPNMKVKTRIKAEPPRRMLHIKNGAGTNSREALGTPENASSGAPRRNETRKADDSPARPQLTLSKPAPPKSTLRNSKVSPAKPSPAKSLNIEEQYQMTPRDTLDRIVEQAEQRAYEVGNNTLGRALRVLFENTLNDKSLAIILDDVLKQKASEYQQQEFQNYIKAAKSYVKKDLNAGTGGRRFSMNGGRSSLSSSKSPSKSGRSGAASGTRNNVTKTEVAAPEQAPTLKRPQREAAVISNRGFAAINGTAKKSSHRMSRSKSDTSLSSLSSLSSLEGNGAPSMEADHANAAETPVHKPPMNAPTSQQSVGPKLHVFPTTNLPSTSHSPSNSLKRKFAATGLVEGEDDATAEAKRKRLMRTFDDVTVKQSSVRASPVIRDSDQDQTHTSESSSLLAPAPGPRLRLGLGLAKKGRDDDERQLSPISAPAEYLVQSLRDQTAMDSRPETPNFLGRPPKKVKKAARVKTSPMKKKSAVIAGISRLGGERDSPMGYGTANDREDENNDFCSACSGSGELLCCDGCDRSFHFTCLDPPMDADNLPDAWFCYICAARRNPQPKPARGLFAALFVELEKENPKAYELPLDIREYFEGVKTGDEGEYEEAVTQKSRTRAGYDEYPDFLKLKDAKGKYVLCFRCGKTALNHKEIIPCDYCSLHWHLDCLDPPMANPPPRLPNGKPRHNWMCPNHVDQELRNLDPSVRTSRLGLGNGGTRTYRVRRPKNAKVIDTALRRGFINNGLIEIENEPSEDEEKEFYDHQEFGQVYRLPERGIKLDFIERVHRARAEAAQERAHAAYIAANQAARLAAAEAKVKANFERRPFNERQVALNLAQLASGDTEIDFSVDQIENLTRTLIAEAPADVVHLIDEGSSKAPAIPPSPPSSESRPDGADPFVSESEKKMLLTLQELIKKRLEVSTTAAA